MANTKISALPLASTPLAGTEVLPIVQGGITEQVATNDLTVRNIRANATTGILQVTGPAAASTRVMTVPDADFTAARTDAAQSFTGNQTLSTGSLILGTSGQGIDFSATPGTGTSELLADYEEGTWTTTLSSVTNFTGTPTLSSALYTKVGRLVTIEGSFAGTVTTGSTLTYFIFTLPFNTSNNASGASGIVGSNGGLTIGAIIDAATGTASTALLYIPATSAQPSGADNFRFSFTYMST
jgi:hypothetical protein